MLGHVLLRYFGGQAGYDVYATSRDTSRLRNIFPEKLAGLFIPENVEADNPEHIIAVIQKVRPFLVINCIGIIKQLPEAGDPVVSIRVNALFPHLIGRACRDLGIRMIHISTDCVFDGKRGAYSESDTTSPDDLYGRTKLIGEVDYPGCVTLRTSIIGHELGSRYGLIEWFLGERGPVQGYANVIYTGLPTIELARIIDRYVIPASGLSGLYHVSSEPITKYDLLRLVADIYGKSIDIEPHHGKSLDRSLRSDRFRSETDYKPPSWPRLIHAMFEDYRENRDQYIK